MSLLYRELGRVGMEFLYLMSDKGAEARSCDEEKTEWAGLGC